MQIAKSSDVKNRFGEVLEMAAREPVSIQRAGRDTAVLLSREEYDRLVAIEDAWWGERACEAEKAGFLGCDESEEFLRKMMVARNSS